MRRILFYALIFLAFVGLSAIQKQTETNGFEQEFSGAGTRGNGATTFFDSEDASPTPALF